MELTEYVRVVRKYWLLLLVAVIVGAAGGWGASQLQRPTYESSTRAFVSLDSGTSTADLAQGTSVALARVATYQQLVNSHRVLDAVIERLDLPMTFDELDRSISATTVPDTTLLEISAVSDDPVEAAALVDATAASLAETVEAIESRAGSASPVRLAVVEPAAVPAIPTSPSIPLNMALGALVALAAAAVFALMRTALDTRIRSERDLRSVTAAPLLGTIALDSRAKRRPLVVHLDPHSPRSESFRTLRTNLQFIEVDGGSRTIVVTSATPGEGKSTTTANLAIAIADAGFSVALVDADLRKPRLAELMGIEGAVGLTDVLIGTVPLDMALQEWGEGGLSVLPAGQLPPNPSELLGSNAMTAQLAALRERFDLVLLDAPPLLPVTDAAVLSKQTETVLLVASAGKATRHQLSTAVQLLDTAGAAVGGVVLTMVPTRGADAHAYGYGLQRRRFSLRRA